MRACVFVGAVIGIVLTSHAATLRGDSGKETEAEQIARLIKQLGDDSFAKRETASEELEDVGEPSLPALRKAAKSSDDAEIRLRAERVIQALRLRVEQKELAAWEGRWRRSDGAEVQIKGDRWTWFIGGKVYASGRLSIAQLGEVTKADFTHTAGPDQGVTVKAIARRRDANFLFRGTSFPTDGYPREFTKDDEWIRVKE